MMKIPAMAALRPGGEALAINARNCGVVSRRSGLEIKATLPPPRISNAPLRPGNPPPAGRPGIDVGRVFGFSAAWMTDSFKISNTTAMALERLSPQSRDKALENLALISLSRESSRDAGAHRMSRGATSLGQLNLDASARDEAHLARARSATDARAERLQATADRGSESRSLWNSVTSFFRSLFS